MIRLMEEKDVPAVAAIEKECFSEPWTEQGFIDAIQSPDNIFIVFEEGAILGYVGLYGSFDEGEITNVAVTDSCRSHGIGYQLMQDIEIKSKEKNIEKIFLEVRKSNNKAISLYKKCGYTDCGVRKNFYRNPVEDGLVMMKILD